MMISMISIYLNKTNILSSKNIHETVDLIVLIDTRLEKIIDINLLKGFIIFYCFFIE